MRDRIDEVGTHATVALVTFTDAASLEAYDGRHDLGFTVLRDPDRAGYRAFGLGRGSIARIWGWRAGRRYIELVLDGGLRGVRRPTEDTRQLGGDFIIGADGKLDWGFWADGPDERPSVDRLIAELHPSQP